MQRIGYTLMNFRTNMMVAEWKGKWGHIPEIPNPLLLPNGDQVCAATLGVPYGDYCLVELLASPTKLDVNEEARRRIILLTGGNDVVDSLVKQVNGEVDDGTKAKIVAIREKGKQIKEMSPIPDNFTDDEYWN